VPSLFQSSREIPRPETGSLDAGMDIIISELIPPDILAVLQPESKEEMLTLKIPSGTNSTTMSSKEASTHSRSRDCTSNTVSTREGISFIESVALNAPVACPPPYVP
jgi:hypothetical protein